MSTETESFVTDGINASTGAPLFAPRSASELAAAACAVIRPAGEEDDEGELLASRRRRDDDAHFGVAEGIDRGDLAQTGWAVLFPAVKPGSEEAKRQAAIREALRVLLEHRRAQATKNHARYYRELAGAEGFRPGETGKKYLQRLKVDPGAAADPEHLPYYILLVATPEEIPFAAQYQLDVTYAVGRICFDDVEDYARYAQSVVEAEREGFSLPRAAAFFGVRNPDDAATRIARDLLLGPLADAVGKNPRRTPELTGWNLPRYFDDAATRATLETLLGGDATPALLFSTSHGVGFDRGDARQLPHQGALLCSDWQNPRPFVPLDERLYLAGDHIASDARLHGMIAFNFACYGAGTPQLDEYALREGRRDDRVIAERPFVSSLHRRLLAHPRGGAVAAVGHIERAWSDSLPGDGGAAGNRVVVFRSALEALMKGLPVGAAMEYFNQRYAYLATEVSNQVQGAAYASGAEKERLDAEIARMWTAHNDARDYVINGDPAARLRVAPSASDARPREALSLQHVAVGAPAAAAVATDAAPQDDPAPASALESFGVVDSMMGFFAGEPTSAPAAEPAPEVELEAEAAPRSSGNPLRDLADRVAKTFGDLVSDVASLEVRTFVSNSTSAVPVTEENYRKTELRAWTRIKIDGDIDVCVPQVDGQVDTALWALHVEMVKQAQAHRAEMFKMVFTTLKDVFKP